MKAKSSLPWSSATSIKAETKLKFSAASAAAAKEAYVAARSVWMSRSAGTPLRYQPPRSYSGSGELSFDGELTVQKSKRDEWAALASWLEENDLPVAYITFTFGQLSADSRPPEPKQLKADKYLDAWQEHMGAAVEITKTQLAIEREIALNAITCHEDAGSDRMRAIGLTLGNTAVQISSLMRVCLATKANTPALLRLAKLFAEEAALEFMRYPKAYEATWSDFLPEGFAERAARLYKDWLSRGGRRAT